MLRSYKSTAVTDGMVFEQIDNAEFIGPEIIYKIRDWTNLHHRKILAKNEIYFASPMAFKDPLDCKLKIDFGSLDSSNSARKLFRNLMLKYPQLNPEYIQDQLFRFIQDKQVYSDDGLGNNLYSKHINEYFQRFGVFSTTLNFETPEMWMHYGGLKHGFCVGFKTSALEDIIHAEGKVKYYGNLPMLPEPDGHNQPIVVNLQFFSKENKWAYEQEYRLAKRWDTPVKNSMRKQRIPTNAIKEVILAPSINARTSAEIRSVLQSSRDLIKLYESKLESGKVLKGRELEL